MKRTASAVWHGDLRTGHGALATYSGVLSYTPYSFGARFEDERGTNPEELLAAAHAGCFTMAIIAALGRAGFTPTRLATQARVSLEQVNASWTITAVHLEVDAWVPDIPAARFHEIAEDAKADCPVSRVLNAKITMHARLEACGGQRPA